MDRSKPETVIHGTVPSKSNCYRIGNNRLFKTEALKSYEDSFLMQCNQRNRGIKGRFAFKMDVYYPSDRSDLDNSLKVVLDCLQSCGAIVNDRKCVEIFARKFIDIKAPRIEFSITPIQ